MVCVCGGGSGGWVCVCCVHPYVYNLQDGKEIAVVFEWNPSAEHS